MNLGYNHNTSEDGITGTPLSTIPSNYPSGMEEGALEPLTIQHDTTTHSKTQLILTVLASFMLTFTACGLNFAFGVYQELYESMSATGPFVGASPAQIDLIGTLGVSLMTIGAPFASAWTKSYSPRTITLFGGLLFGLANILASFGQKLWHFILTQGFLLGCATCLIYIPAVTIPPGWFSTHRGLALGIISSGTGIGGVVWAPALRALNDAIGFRDALRLTGAVSFVVISLSGMILKWDPDSERRNRLEAQTNRSRINVPLVDWHMARSRKFLAQCVSASLQSAAYYAPVYFFSSFARTLGYSAATGATFISISNASSAVGKIAIGYIADRFGRLNVLFISTFISSLTVLGLWLPSTLAGGDSEGKSLFLAYAVLYGIFAGTYVSLFPAALVELFGVQHFASVNGFLYMMRGFACLIGTPAAGALIRGSGSGGEGLHVSKAYLRSSILVGVLLFGAAVGVAWVRVEAVVGLARRRDGEKRRWRI